MVTEQTYYQSTHSLERSISSYHRYKHNVIISAHHLQHEYSHVNSENHRSTGKSCEEASDAQYSRSMTVG